MLRGGYGPPSKGKLTNCWYCSLPLPNLTKSMSRCLSTASDVVSTKRIWHSDEGGATVAERNIWPSFGAVPWCRARGSICVPRRRYSQEKVVLTPTLTSPKSQSVNLLGALQWPFLFVQCHRYWCDRGRSGEKKKSKNTWNCNFRALAACRSWSFAY